MVGVATNLQIALIFWASGGDGTKGSAPFSAEPFVLSPAVKNVKVRIYKTIIVPVVLYRCETWSLTVRDEHKLRVFENRVLKRIFGLKRDRVTGGWRKLHN
jgi:hypothetical protein